MAAQVLNARSYGASRCHQLRNRAWAIVWLIQPRRAKTSSPAGTIRFILWTLRQAVDFPQKLLLHVKCGFKTCRKAAGGSKGSPVFIRATKETQVLPETKLDRFIYMGAVPLLAAMLGGVAGALLQAQSCSIVGASEIKALLENAQLNGAQKVQFMKDYLELTDRPWSLARSVVTFVTSAGTLALGFFAASGGFSRR